MPHLLALVYALSVVTLSVTAAAATILSEKNDAFSPPMLVTADPPKLMNYPVQGVGLPTPTSQQQPSAMDCDHVRSGGTSPPVSTAADNSEVRPTNWRRWSYATANPPVSPKNGVDNWPAPWPKLLASEVVIYSDDYKYLTVNGEVRWDKEGRQGPVFRWTDDYPGNSEKLFLERVKIEGESVTWYLGGSVTIKSSTNNTHLLHDRHGELSFHFEKVGHHYRIYFSNNGTRYGPPARLQGDTTTLFNVGVIASPNRISAFQIVKYEPSKTYNTTLQYAVTVCSSAPMSYDFPETQGDSYQINVLSGEPDVSLQPPLPGILEQDWGVTVQNGGFKQSFRRGKVSLTHPPYRATLVAVTKEEVKYVRFWTATMAYLSGKTRMVAGQFTIWSVEKLVSARIYPGDLFSPRTCRPIAQELSYLGIDSHGERTTFEDHGVDYPWAPRLVWI